LFTLISYALASKVSERPFNITVGIILGAYPVLTLFLLLGYKDSLIDRSTLERYWSLYGNLKFKNTTALFYPFVSTLRKIMFVFGTIYLEEYSYFQVQLFTLMNMFYSIFFAGIHPNSRQWDFRLELYNEWAIQIMCFHLICFTDMV
jgi:hypothetical protein